MRPIRQWYGPLIDKHAAEIEKMRVRHHDIANWQEALPVRLDAIYARKETLSAQLEGIAARLGNIERALRIGPQEEV